MQDDVIVGLDAGTSVIKAVAFDRQGCELAKTQCENRLETLPDGGVEQSLPGTWEAASFIWVVLPVIPPAWSAPRSP